MKLLSVSAVVMGIAQTIAKERIFAWLRDALGGSGTWLGYLVSCPYCLSYWLAFGLVPLTQCYFLRTGRAWGWPGDVLDWLLSSVLVTVMAAFLRVVFWYIDESQGLVRREQRVAERKAEATDTRGPMPS